MDKAEGGEGDITGLQHGQPANAGGEAKSWCMAVKCTHR